MRSKDGKEDQALTEVNAQCVIHNPQNSPVKHPEGAATRLASIVLDGVTVQHLYSAMSTLTSEKDLALSCKAPLLRPQYGFAKGLELSPYLGAGMHRSASSTRGMGRQICRGTATIKPLQNGRRAYEAETFADSTHLDDDLPHRHAEQNLLVAGRSTSCCGIPYALGLARSPVKSAN